MATRRFLSLIVLLCALTHTRPTEGASYLLLQSSYLAGFNYHQAASVWPQLQEGDALHLIEDASNPFDDQAIGIAWQGKRLGYLPKTENGAITAALRQGIALKARIGKLRNHPNPRARILVEIFIVL